MRWPKRPGWLATNLLLLAATIFIGVLLFFLSDLFTDDARSTGVIVSDALAASILFGLLIFVQALPGGVAYLFLMRKIAQRASEGRLRALALLLSPIAIVPLFFLVEALYPLALALPYGAVVRLPKQTHPPQSNT